MNFIPAKMLFKGSRTIVKIDRVDAKPLEFDIGPKSESRAPFLEKKILLGVRPETITEASGVSAPGHLSFEAPIDILEPTGADTYAVISLGGVAVTARCRPRSITGQGNAQFQIDTNAVLMFDPETEIRID